MPIRGLTDQQLPSFPEIGKIRKGAPKPTDTPKPGKDLTFFRVEFDEGEQDAQAKFAEVYGDEPTELNIWLPYDDIERVWEAWREGYTSGALVHRCDGKKVVYAIDPANGVFIEDHPPCEGVAMTMTKAGLVPYKTAKGQTIPCKPSGRLRVIIPELRRLAYLTVLTTSIHDIINISNQLAAIQRLTGGKLAGVPLVLRRRPKEISTPSGSNGQRARRVKWLLSIEADPLWVGPKLKEMTAAIMPQIGGAQVAALPAPEQWEPDPDDDTIEGDVTDITDDTDEEPVIEGEIHSDNGGEPEAKGSSKPEIPTNGHPWKPDLLKAVFSYNVQQLISGNAQYAQPATVPQQQTCAMIMEEIWAGDEAAKQNRYGLLKELCGEECDSCSKLTKGQASMMIRWITKEEKDSGNRFIIQPYVRQEADAVLAERLEAKGQKALL